MLVFNYALIFLVVQTKDVVGLQNELMQSPPLQSSVLWTIFSFLSVFWFSMMCWWTAHFIFSKSQGAITAIENHVSVLYGISPGLMLVIAGFLRQQYAILWLGIALVISVFILTYLINSSLNQGRSRFIPRQLDRIIRSCQSLTLWNSVITISFLWLCISLSGSTVLALLFIFNVAATAATLKAFVTIYLGLGSMLFGMTLLTYLLACGTSSFRFTRPLHEGAATNEGHRKLRLWLLPLLTLLQLALLLFLCVKSLVNAQFLLAIVLICSIGAVLVVQFWPRLISKLQGATEHATHHSWDQTLLELYLRLIGIALLFAISWQFSQPWVPAKAAWLAAILALCSAVIRSGGLSNWRGTGNFFQPPLRVFTSSVLLAIALAYIVPSDNHGVRRCLTSAPAGAEFPKCPATKDGNYDYAFKSTDEAFTNFQTRLPAHEVNNPAKQPVFFVTSQGGGLRASYWSGSVLAHIQQRAPAFSQHLFALTGVSGGAVGNTFYVGALQQLAGGNTSELPRDFITQVQHRIGRDYLSPVTASFLNNDLMFRFAPIWLDPYQKDRATVLEQSWEHGFMCSEENDFCPQTANQDGHGLAAPLQTFYRNSQSPEKTWLPLLISLGMQQESGSRLITAPFPVEPDTFPASYDVYEQMQCKAGSTLSCDLRLSTAALNAARFPYLTPAGSLNFDQQTGTEPPEPKTSETSAVVTPAQWIDEKWRNFFLYTRKTHIIDGGYYNNYGSDTLLQLLRRLEPLLRTNNLEPVVIVLLNDPAQTALSLDPNRRQPVSADSWTANEITAPPQGMLSDRAGHGDASLTELQLYMQSLKAVTANFYAIRIPDTDQYQSLPLGWWLSEQSKTLIDKLLCEADSEQARQIAEIAEKLSVANNLPSACEQLQ